MRVIHWLQMAGGGLAFVLSLARPSQAVAQFLPPNSPIDPIIGPMVRITSPANYAVFHTPVDVVIFAHAVDRIETTNLDFYAGTNLLGAAINLGAVTTGPGWLRPIYMGPVIPRLNAEYCFVWSNAPAGSYALTAVTRSLGAFLTRTSPPVNITISAPTNTASGASVVSIVATDPVAIAGTNSWIWRGGLTNALPSWTNWPPPIWKTYTNWGPRDGLFTVRRFGDATDAETVNYSISGTATNGVDYAMLSGSVVIPAGGAYALAPIVPIDNDPPYVPKTVILTLAAPTNASNYVIGFPSRAAVAIEHAWPRPLPLFLPDASFHFNAPGPDGTWFVIEHSTNLLDWTADCTNQAFQGSLDFVDAAGTNYPGRFYRAIPQAGAAPQ
ncbi:MAG TPA: Ig-like domain-containing protein [Candidatus Saccharimonadales bacterium]|nr:Ig-like domain-containing protein [Candidatus Saccharimonadales bacterium]